MENQGFIARQTVRTSTGRSRIQSEITVEKVVEKYLIGRQLTRSDWQILQSVGISEQHLKDYKDSLTESETPMPVSIPENIVLNKKNDVLNASLPWVMLGVLGLILFSNYGRY